MILRPYQKRLVTRARAALAKHGNTLCIAATGAGKTIMLSGLGAEVGGRQLVLQHRQELVRQNMQKYMAMNPHRTASLFTADVKSMRGDTVFAMQQTLCRNLDAIPKLDMLVVDETHHIIAPTFRSIIDRVRSVNPKCYLAGFTATPERGDRGSLRDYFSNVSDQITIKELVGLGFLVPPRAIVVDTGVRHALEGVKVSDGYGDQTEVAKIMNTAAVNAEVVRHWRERAVGRRTIVFCANVAHAQAVAAAFTLAGVPAGCVHAGMEPGPRAAVLARHDRGEITVLTNVAILTEGYDSPPVSCVVLLRQCSKKGPMIQMAGRGLRIVPPEKYPGVAKADCIIMDFGTSLITHGDLEMADGLHVDRDREALEAPTKKCPTAFSPALVYRFPDKTGAEGCGAEVPCSSKVCPLCGFVFERIVGEEEGYKVDLTEINILDASPFRYIDLWGNDLGLMASGFSAWAGVFSPDGGETWHALGKVADGRAVHKLAVTGRMQAIATADDYMRTHETDGAAKKNKRWLTDPPTPKQCALLARYGYGDPALSKYAAACLINFEFSKLAIERALGVQ